MTAVLFALKVGWLGMLMGVISGAIIGLQFHKKDWLGGYSARPRRFVRLGHISFFGIGLLNLFYGLSLPSMGVSSVAAMWGAYLLLGALVSMPACCFLTAWKMPFRHLFPVPVLCASAGILIILTS
ncbi:MAG: hypothetical protein H7A51_07565 [Akkermansiaceae bacterium]|nr:hypothetical protein [Akkermansiaceae bacterium]